MIRNKFHGRCSECRCRVLAEDGWLSGKDPDTGRWRILCDDCRPATDYRAGYRAAGYRTHETSSGARWSPPPGWEDDPIIREARRLRAERGDFWWLADRPYPPIPQCLQVLGLRPPADAESIRKQYRALAHRYHPDHGGSAAEFIRIKRAFDEALSLAGGTA
jgi:hypothetical protein